MEIVGIIIILAIIAAVVSYFDKILHCNYCGRDIKRKDLKDGKCAYCNNQIE